MANTKREHNKNFFKWEPVEDGSRRFTPNAPLNWFYEIVDLTDFSEEEKWDPDLDNRSNAEEIIVANQLLKLTPSNEQLLKAAKSFPPPPEWFANDEECPF